MFVKLIRIYTYVRINHTPIYKIESNRIESKVT